MNERIQELAEQAEKYAREYVVECKHYGHYMEHNEYNIRFKEKFAELIIRECAKISFDHWCDGTNEDSAEVDILKHFGLKVNE